MASKKQIPKNSEQHENPKILSTINDIWTPYTIQLLKNNKNYVELLKKSLIDIVDNLNTDRLNNYYDCIKLGIVLYKFGFFGLDLWDKFTDRFNKYDSKKLMFVFEDFDLNNDDYYGCLLIWLRNDSFHYFTDFLLIYEELFRYAYECNIFDIYVSFFDVGCDEDEYEKNIYIIKNNELICEMELKFIIKGGNNGIIQNNNKKIKNKDDDIYPKSNNNNTIYVLKLENGKYYVGRSIIPKHRILNHFGENGCEWTKLHKPVSVMLCVKGEKVDEEKYTFLTMQQYGIDNVRGGAFCTILMSKAEKSFIEKILLSIDDKCYKCGIYGHFAKDCGKQNKASLDLENDNIPYIATKTNTKHVILKRPIKKINIDEVSFIKNNKQQIIVQNLIKPLTHEKIWTPYTKQLLKNNENYVESLKKSLIDIIDNLNTDRNNDYNKWIQLGMVLFKFGEFGIDLWDKFSKYYEDHNPNELKNKLKMFNMDNNLNYESLLSWLKIDSMKYYNEFLQIYGEFINYIYKNNNKSNSEDELTITDDETEIDDKQLENTQKKIIKDDKVDIFSVLEYTQADAAKFYIEHRKNIIKISQGNIYTWNENLKLWLITQKCAIINDLVNFWNDEIKKSIQNIENKISLCKNKETLKKLKKTYTYYVKSAKKYANSAYCENIYNISKHDLTDDTFYSILDDIKHVINFKNGLYDLKTGNFRERNQNDYFTKALSYDYNPVLNNDIITEIQTILLQIANDDDKLLQFNLDWLGYCITGETCERMALFVIGHSAENGKTTMAKIFSKSLDIYSAEICRRTFEEGYQNAHKQLNLIGKPIRFIMIEELGINKLNVELFKKVVDGNELRIEQLYGTTINMQLHTKFYITSNKDPRFHNDNGIARRGLAINLKNKFVKKEQYEKDKNTKGVYLRNEKLDVLFDNVEYKLAFVQLLLPYAQKYYSGGLTIPNFVTENFKEICEENDKMKIFIDEYYEITKNVEHMVNKDQFLKKYNDHYSVNATFVTIISDVKRFFTYDKD